MLRVMRNCEFKVSMSPWPDGQCATLLVESDDSQWRSNCLMFVMMLFHRVCNHWRRKVKGSQTSCPENHCKPDCERACHVPPRPWRHDVCIWSDSRLEQTDLLSLWHWRHSCAEGIWFSQNKWAAFVKFTSWVFVWQHRLSKLCKAKTNSEM